MQIVVSSVIYIAVFLFSSICLRFVYMSPEKTTGRRAGVVISILTLCLLAAFRGEGVGTDTISYYESFRTFSNMSSIESVLSYCARTRFEVGFGIYTFIIAKIFKNYGFFLFICEALTVIPIYIVLNKTKKVLPPWNGLLIYLFMFYNASFNTTRQWISVSCICLAFILYIEDKKKSAIVITVISAFAHRGALIGICFMIMGIANYNRKKLQRKQLVFMLFLIFAMAGICYSSEILQFLANHNILVSYTRQTTYIRLFSGETGLSRFQGLSKKDYLVGIIKIWLVLLPILFYRFRRADYSELRIPVNAIYVASTIIYAVASFVFKTIQTYRITVYGEVFAMIYLSQIFGYENSESRGKVVVSLSGLIINFSILAYWILEFMVSNHHATNIYTFKFW